MPFEWKALVAVARDLEVQASKGISDPEALQRSAVSRAYFGAYCHARNYAKTFLKFEPKEDADDHGRLRSHLSGKRRQNIAKHLERLRQWRNDADYQDYLPWNDISATVAAAIKEADGIILSLVPPSASAGS